MRVSAATYDDLAEVKARLTDAHKRVLRSNGYSFVLAEQIKALEKERDKLERAIAKNGGA